MQKKDGKLGGLRWSADMEDFCDWLVKGVKENAPKLCARKG
jgi:hypothetical protein